MTTRRQDSVLAQMGLSRRLPRRGSQATLNDDPSKLRDILLEPIRSTQCVDLGLYENSTINEVEELTEQDDIEEGAPVFAELLKNAQLTSGGSNLWLECARWIKFAESVETDGRRWSKPHVTLLTLPSLLQLRNCFRKGVHHFNSTARTYEAVVEEVIKAWDGRYNLEMTEQIGIHEILLKSRILHLIGSQFRDSVGRTNPAAASQEVGEAPENEAAGTVSQITRKIKDNSQGAVAFVTRCPELTTTLAAFVRLKKEQLFPGILEASIPVRFFFFLLAPTTHSEESLETVGRAFGCLMIDEIFAKVAFRTAFVYAAVCRANSCEPLMGAVDEFLSQVTTIPAGKCPAGYRMEPSEDYKKEKREVAKSVQRLPVTPNTPSSAPNTEKPLVPAGLERTGRLFGGLLEDMRRKRPFYRSEFDDGLQLSALTPVAASAIFMFIAQVTKLIGFGVVTQTETKGLMGISEHLLSGAVSGCVFALFAGQPLSIPSPSGATFLFELTLYKLCFDNDWAFLPFRFWIGFWVFVSMMLFTAFDASALVSFATKFTQEPFAIVNGIVFMISSVKSLLKLKEKHDITYDPVSIINSVMNGHWTCDCVGMSNNSVGETFASYNYTDVFHKQGKLYESCHATHNGRMLGELCTFFPGSFLLSTLLFLCTILLVSALTKLRNSVYFPAKVRSVVSDFSVLISVAVMTAIAQTVHLKIATLSFPEGMRPTAEGRSWFVNPFSIDPWYLPLIAIFPGLLFALLNILGQAITAAIVNRKEHKLRKGFGYHLDLFVMGWLTLLCSFLGIPFIVSGPVVSIVHIESLKRYSENAAPGEKPQFLGVREQRVSSFVCHLLVGFSIFMAPFLSVIPSSVLFGIFFFMGISSLFTQAMFLRTLLFLIPVKYQPDYKFLRLVRLKQVHLYTAIQLFAFGLLMIVNYVPKLGIIFPLALLVLMATRKVIEALHVLTRQELEALDMRLLPFRHVWRPLTQIATEPNNATPGKTRFASFKARIAHCFTRSSAEKPEVDQTVAMNVQVTESMETGVSVAPNGVAASCNGFDNPAASVDRINE